MPEKTQLATMAHEVKIQPGQNNAPGWSLFFNGILIDWYSHLPYAEKVRDRIIRAIHIGASVTESHNPENCGLCAGLNDKRS